MTMWESQFASSFRQHFPDLLGSRLLVAASGGPDSTALLLLLLRTGQELGLELGVAHVHHGVRGPEADEDAAFCQKLAADFRLPFFLDRLPPPPQGVSKEAWWRQQRYRKLQARQQEFAAAAVATGHTLDDQAETVLLKLLRGAGPRGVAGIRRRWDFVIRPLLDFRRHQLREYLRQLGQPFREDSSNWVADRPRTFLRLRVMPLLEEAFPKACQHLAAFAQELLQDEELLAAWVEEKVPPLRLGGKATCGPSFGFANTLALALVARPSS